ncbi:tetratricopeptide repeat protein [Amycolatopsis acidicola]|uniref:Tetratricopeptide repeat protein n=1 Tax=Amycolatopsis acidicola TaxID=2596893 RepID=A0A5N0UNW8_9PSEU|nr:tetratricopeptide repeat protein [Amycolatopsis acidicola]KAA9151173.1 tetratricopeptide repeat protein [Amycolatopsis acidicola]
MPLFERRRRRVAAAADNSVIRTLRDGGAIQLVPLDGLDPLRLGVHPAWQLPDGEPLPPYVPRTADAQLDRALAKGGLVVLQGDSASGKTRSAYEAVRRNASRLGWRTLLIPRDTAALRTLASTSTGLTETVLWLDDLDRYLSTDSLDDGLLGALCPPGRPDVVLLATLRTGARRAIDTDKTGRMLSAPVLLGRRLDQAETAVAQRFRGDPRIAEALDGDAGLAEQLAAAPAAVQRWRTAGHEPGAALVSGAVDLRRAGYLDPVPLDWLAELHTVYLSEPYRSQFGETDLGAALAWATEPVRGAARALRPVDAGYYVAFDYLVDAAEAAGDAIPEQVWQRLLGTQGLSVDQMFRIAGAAARHGHVAEASRLWTVLAAGNDPFAMYNLGWAAQVSDDDAAAEGWYLRAAEAGNSWAMSALGAMAEARQDVEGAERWYRRAALAGDTKGLTNLGGLFAQTGRIEHARAAYRQASAAGDLAGVRKEAVLEILHGDRKRGGELLRRVALAGDPAAVRLLGLLSQTENVGVPREDVQELRRVAAEEGDTDAALELARSLWSQGDLDAAETWFRRAATAEDGKVAEFGLAVLLEQRGRTEDAEAWYRRAADHGLPEAMLNLGAILQEHGEYTEAERWYHQALGAGHLPAEVNLGALHWHRGNLAEGTMWYERAASRGDELAKQALANAKAGG